MKNRRIARNKERLLAKNRAFRNVNSVNRDGKYCYRHCCDCGGKMVVSEIAKANEEVLGEYEINVRHWECPACHSWISDRRCWHAEETARRNRIRELLLEKYPPCENAYLDEREVEMILGLEEGEAMRKGPLWFGIYHMLYNGREIYLRKSVELFRKGMEERNGKLPSGEFPLV